MRSERTEPHANPQLPYDATVVRFGSLFEAAPLVGALALAACVPKSAVVSRPSSELYRDVDYLARGLAPIRRLTPNEARGARHVRVTWEGDRIVGVEHVAPSGLVQERDRVEWASDGSRRVWHVDGYGKLAWIMVVGTSGRVVASERDGASHFAPCVTLAVEHDAKGRPAQVTCLDLLGHEIPDVRGCPVLRYEHDEAGSVVGERCFKADGSPAERRERGHQVAYTLGAAGLPIAAASFDARGAPVADKEGCTTERFELDAAGDAVRATCFDAAGAPHGRGGGHASTLHFTRDENGCVVEEERLSAEGELVSVLVHRPDRHCSDLRLERRDGKRALVDSPQNAAITESTINSTGQKVERRCFNRSGAASSCVNVEGEAGSVVRFAYDGAGLRTAEWCFDPAGNKTNCSSDYPHEQRYTYDAMGGEVDMVYFDAKGEPSAALGTVSRTRFLHDDAGRLVAIKDFGVDGRPVEPSTRCHEIRFSYDLVGRLLALDCRNMIGELTVASLCFRDICWGPQAARVVVEWLPGRVANIELDVHGDVLRRIDCGTTRCYD
jgi:hypothetical protein